MRVLITGVASPRGQRLARRLIEEGHEVVGVDLDAYDSPHPGLEFHRLDHRKRGFEDLVRRVHFDAICHLAIHAGFRLHAAERHRYNLEGSQKVIAQAAAHGVKKLVFASHAAIYGALPDNPCFMTEDAPPAVGRVFPEMQDVVSTDLLAGAAMWKHPAIEIVVLRSVNCLGPTSRDTLGQILRFPRVPTLLGFNPMMQIIHEEDLTRAYAAALTPGLRGVFNVVGPGEVPLSILVRESGAKRVALPEPLVRAMLGRFGLPDAGRGVLEFLKHPCLVDGSRFAKAAKFTAKYDLVATARSMRRGGG